MAPQVYHIADLTDHLADALDIARDLAAGDTRWTNALNAGADWLLQQNTVTFDAEAHELTFTNEQGKVYRSNGACRNITTGEPCKAFHHGQACRHRAASRLLKRALELRAQRAANAARRAGLEPLHEVEALADEIHATEGGAWIDARHKAEGLMPELLALASEWNASAALGARLAAARAPLMECFA